ncbi:esterase B1-like [Haematobia irritans]|uniref:esterase B1-like n=1 Tax=Haematobia irritans TaxID=7368 RepID=UPI003F50A4F4
MAYFCSEKQQLDFKLRTLEFKVNQWHSRINDEDGVSAKIHTGKIRGSKRLSIYNRVYYSFERIPYALPPVGELRFRAPKPMTPWKYVKDCSSYGPKCMQLNPMDGNIEGSEDCLFINVYTNNLKPTKPRPIMFWVHGGGFWFGEANTEWYGPDYFIEKDVILITFQYRLGALGFLSLNEPGLHTPGNAGLKDMILALKWVKRNAYSFGGNPENVTIFGESAGGCAVHLLTLSEHARGLFHRVILQSGIATGDWAITDCSSRTYELAQKAGYKGENKERLILKYLLKLSAEEIVQAEKLCVQRNDRETFAFGPCVEPYFTAHTVIYKPVEELLPHAWGNSLPFILGANSLEGLFFKRQATISKDLIIKMLQTCSQCVPKAAATRLESPECIDKGLKLRKIHVKGAEPTLDDYYEIISFVYYWHPIQKAIEARLKYARKSSTFLYRFDFHTNKLTSPFRYMYTERGDTDAHCGVAHTEELTFLFSSALAKPMERQTREYQCMKRMITLWTQFAETGNPNSAKLPDIKWRGVQNPRSIPNSEPFKCLNIGDELSFIDLPEMEKLRVWKSLYEIHRTIPKSTKEDMAVIAYVQSSL